MTFENNLSFISTTATSGSGDQFDDGSILDDMALQIMRDVAGEEDEDLTDLGDGAGQTPGFPGTGDPPELVPFGICTCATRVDWGKLGYGNDAMRPVAKLILVSWTKEDGLHVEVHWDRSPHHIETLKQNPYPVYSDYGQKGLSASEDLEEHVLKTQQRILQDKLRRTKQAMKQKGPKTPVQAYLPVHHQLPFVVDEGGNNLKFQLRPGMIQAIQDASDRFSLFERRANRTHSKKKKTASTKASEDESDDGGEFVSAPKRRIGRQSPVVVFNEMLKKLLAKLIQRPGDEFWQFRHPVMKKVVPNYYNVIHSPMCFDDIERKANNLEYTTIAKFWADVKLIESNCRLFNTQRYPHLVTLGEKMIAEFQNELGNVRDELNERESEIDPVLRAAD
jgi:hypothetical protein